MKFWKRILKITLAVLVVFVIMILCMMFKYYTADINYPHPSIFGDMDNWFEDFICNLALYMVIVGIPLLIDIILLIMSIAKIRYVNKK